MNYFGTFNEYTPDTLPDGMPGEMKSRVLWLRNEFGDDLYEVRKNLPTGHLFITVEADGRIRVVHDDPHHVWPANGGLLYATADVITRDPVVLMTKRVDHATKTIVDRPPAVPKIISDRQFAQGLAVAGIISEQEAEDWVGPGVVPAAMLALVGQLPEAERFAARMLLRGATSFERDNPLTGAIGALYNWAPGQVDQFWRDCAAL